jgi:uncharacterized NAD(P)/FAD-binding protein YdhS
MADQVHYDVAIVGAGFCGTMVAVNLARANPRLSIALIECDSASGPGLAYGTRDPDHLLNVRAAHMGAFADDPGHFWTWLSSHPQGKMQNAVSEQGFASRSIYGEYLEEILRDTRAAYPGLIDVKRRIVDLRRGTDANFELTSDDGAILTATRCVLALGNFPPAYDHTTSLSLDPYDTEVWSSLAKDGDILIIGTGLTSLDLVVTMAKTKKSGVVHLLSRHGLLPREHTPTVKPYTLVMQAPFPPTALGLLRAVRKEIEGATNVPWQSVIDALRPHNQSLWLGLSLVEKQRFMRHLRAYWDVHRHRCAPAVMDAYRTLELDGRIMLHSGSIVKQEKAGNGWAVKWRPRGSTQIGNLAVKKIVRATGPQADFRKIEEPLVQSLLKQRLIVSDALHLGLVTAEDYTVCDADGNKVENLYALGSVLKGRLYESVAVPELRVQAAEVAAELSTPEARSGE